MAKWKRGSGRRKNRHIMSRQEYVMSMANMSAADVGAVLADVGQDDEEYGDLTVGVQVAVLEEDDDEGDQQGEAGA